MVKNVSQMYHYQFHTNKYTKYIIYTNDYTFQLQ